MMNGNNIQDIKKEDLLPGTKLVYVNYDQINRGLSIFQDEDQENDFIPIFKEYVIKVV